MSVATNRNDASTAALIPEAEAPATRISPVPGLDTRRVPSSIPISPTYVMAAGSNRSRPVKLPIFPTSPRRSSTSVTMAFDPLSATLVTGVTDFGTG